MSHAKLTRELILQSFPPLTSGESTNGRTLRTVTVTVSYL